MSSQIEYKRSYTLIFVFYYLCEGFLQGIPFLVWPAFMAHQLGGSYDIAKWLIIYSIGNIPWAIKMIVGLFNTSLGFSFHRISPPTQSHAQNVVILCLTFILRKIQLCSQSSISTNTFIVKHFVIMYIFS